jgi:alpha-L-fucosidase
LNFGPDALGQFPPEQLGVLNKLSLWMFVNREAMDGTIPHPKKTRQDNL